ncbi:MAG: tetratricopeptide repeat protein [Bacteroidota bacterium]
MEMALDSLSGVELVKMHCRLAFVYAFQNMDKAYEHGHRALELANASDDLLAKTNAYRNLGIVYDVDSKGDSALIYFTQSLDYAILLDSKQEIAMSTNNLGMYHWNKGLLGQAVKYFIDAKAIHEAINDTIGMSSSLNNVCLIYNELNQSQKAVPYCEAALTFRRAYRDTMEILQSLNNLGIAKEHLGHWKASRKHFEEGLALSQFQGFEHMKDEFLAGLSNIHILEGNYTLARQAIHQGLEILEKNGELNALHKQYAKAAQIENLLGNYPQAEKYAQNGLAITDSLQISTYNVALYKSLAEAQFSLGKREAGLESLDRWDAAKDSTFSKTNAEAIAQKEVEYHTQKKEQKILLQKAELAKRKSQNQFILSLSLASFLFLLLSFMLKRNREKLKQEKALSALKLKAQNDQFLAVIATEEKERKRLARDLHDGLGQILSTARMNVAALEESHLIQEDQAIVNNSIALIDRAVNEMRSVSYDLMPRTLEKSGLINALREMVQKINTATPNLIHFQSDVEQIDWSDEKKTILYRIVQELINNCLKHSSSDRLELQIKEAADNLHLLFKQNKGQVNVGILQNGRGIGWSNIQSRVELLNGQIAIDPLQEGTQFSLVLQK